MINHLIENLSDTLDLQTYTKDNKYVECKIDRNDLGYLLQFEDHENFCIVMKNFSTQEQNELVRWIKTFTNPIDEATLIFGKDKTPNVVSIDIQDSKMEVFTETNGIVSSEIRKNLYWLLSPRKFDNNWKELKGNLHYKYIKYYDTKVSLYNDKNKYKTCDLYSIANEKEAAMLVQGLTYYKGMKVSDVSILSFDIESMGLAHDKNSRVLLISNTFLKNGVRQRKLFAYDDYSSDKEFLDDWCNWVREVNPSIICGHNIFSYDFPYMQFCADKAGTELLLGRNKQVIKFDKYTSKFRRDGSQDYDYKRCYIYGREIIDTMFLAYHFDFARKYESYGLKQIIKQEGLEIKDRVFYEAANISKDYLDSNKWQKIKKYAEHDADDALALYQLMIPSYFYLTPSIPKSFQTINYSATGSQINSFLVRSYLQQGHSIPRADMAVKFTGAISDGFPGIYKNVFKVDVASLYPSIMLQYEVYHPKKDPERNFLNMVNYFTKERLVNKKLGKDTGDRYYKDMEQAQKIVINSSYGLLGANGLNFNYPEAAALVTEKGRDILKKAMLWATGKEYIEKIVEEEEDEI